jgi:flavin-dependent dehydrogenase
MDFDIVIIGAGIAGLSAADAITGCSNLSLACVEGEDVGSNNPSPLTFIEVVKNADLIDCSKEKYSRLVFHNYQGSSIEYKFHGETLVVLDYKAACAKLLNRIAKRKKPIHFIKKYAISMRHNNEGILVQLQDGSQIRTRILIDASGKSQIIAHHLGFHSGLFYSHVYGGFFSGVKLPDKKLCCLLLPNQTLGSGGGWFYSIGGDQASFGYARISQTPEPDYSELEKNFHIALREFAPYSHYLRDSQLDYSESGVIPISYTDKFVDGNMVIVGDAAGMATNWTCMGIEPALKYGKLAGEIVTRAILQKDNSTLETFQVLWLRENREKYDEMKKNARKFWHSHHHSWEWIIKNDLAYLSPSQVLGRLRWNSNVMKTPQVFLRGVTSKIRSSINREMKNPQAFTISQ